MWQDLNKNKLTTIKINQDEGYHWCCLGFKSINPKFKTNQDEGYHWCCLGFKSINPKFKTNQDGGYHWYCLGFKSITTFKPIKLRDITGVVLALRQRRQNSAFPA